MNTAKRVESIAQEGMILVSDKTLSVLGNSVETASKIEVCLKGLERTREIHEIAWRK